MVFHGTWAADSFPSGAVPLTLVVLGAFFYSPPPPATEPQPPSTLQKIKQTLGLAPREPSRPASKPAAVATPTSKTRPGENRAVFVAVTSRMIVTPLLFMPLLAALAKYDLFRAAEDPVFIVLSLIHI